MAERYVRYREGIEASAPDEAAVIERIVAAMRRIAETTLDHYGHAARPSHAKGHGLLTGELEVLPGLPQELRQGLRAEPRRYPALVRLAPVPGDILVDSVTTQRGLSLKVLGVAGPMLPGHEGAATQDFLLDNHPSFPVPDAAGFLGTIEALEPTTERLGPVKKAVSAAARGANAVLNAVGAGSAALDFFGHPPRHPLADIYYSQAPLRWGEHIAKVAVGPDAATLEALAGIEVDPHASFSAVRDAVVAFMKAHPAVLELRVQLCTDLGRMPVEDASVAWPEEESPYRAVARLVLPPQDAWSPARRVYAGDVLSFCPGHGLAAHRPLGSIMRARLKAYPVLSRFRHEMNQRPMAEPRSIDEVPA
jgi:hypothetical protein